MKRDKVIREVLGDENAITPSDLCNQPFRRAVFGGYKMDEVDAFLNRAADQLESLLEQLRLLKAQNEEQKGRIEEYRQMEGTLRSALISSQKFGEDTVDAARREAQALVEEARAIQAKAEAEAARLPEALSQEIRLLTDKRERLRAEILAILDTHRALLARLPQAGLPEFKRQPLSPSTGSDPTPLPGPNVHNRRGRVSFDDSDTPPEAVLDPAEASKDAMGQPLAVRAAPSETVAEDSAQ